MVRQKDQLIASQFSLEGDGIIIATFAECSGLGGEIEVQTYREGGLNEYEHKLPGATKWGNVTLSSGVADSTALWDWFEKASQQKGTVGRAELSIVMYGQDRGGSTQGEKMRWNLAGAYPVRWEGPAFKASDNSVSVHSLEIAHNGVKLIKH
jgi:phage tail-like protein